MIFGRKRSTFLLAAVLIGTACAGSETEADVPGAPASAEPGAAGEAGNPGIVVDETEPPVTTTTVASPITAAPTTAPPPPSTQAPAPAPTPAPTAPPTTTLQLARCVDGEINFFTTGRRGEIALYQQTLKNLGYDPGEVDGFFGQNTYSAASQEILDNGNINGPNGAFEELFPDDGAVLPAAFDRLGIGCT